MSIHRYNPSEESYESYEPTPEELKEIEELINAEEEKEEALEELRFRVKNRIFIHYSSETHWEGWLRIHGIRW